MLGEIFVSCKFASVRVRTEAHFAPEWRECVDGKNSYIENLIVSGPAGHTFFAQSVREVPHLLVDVGPFTENGAALGCWQTRVGYKLCDSVGADTVPSQHATKTFEQ